MTHRLRRRPTTGQRVAAALVVVLVVGSCRGGSDGARTETACVPSGDRLVLSADELKFDRSCLAAPPDQPFAIAFTNDESLPHNVEILKKGESTERVFQGEIFAGRRTVTYQVPPLAPATYAFRCTVHPQMTGMVRVG